jgi:hypothetical protein
MNAGSKLTRLFRTVGVFAVLTGLGVNAIPMMAQNTPDKANRVVTIDGSVEPERIPDWILWREIFNFAAMLADKSPKAGRETWVEKLGLSTEQMNQFTAFARVFRDGEKQIDRDVKAVFEASRRNSSEPVMSRLHEIQADKESRILAHRDALRSRIGTIAFLRLQSFGRLHIAPGIRVIGTVQDGK